MDSLLKKKNTFLKVHFKNSCLKTDLFLKLEVCLYSSVKQVTAGKLKWVFSLCFLCGASVHTFLV